MGALAKTGGILLGVGAGICVGFGVVGLLAAAWSMFLIFIIVGIGAGWGAKKLYERE